MKHSNKLSSEQLKNWADANLEEFDKLKTEYEWSCWIIKNKIEFILNHPTKHQTTEWKAFISWILDNILQREQRPNIVRALEAVVSNYTLVIEAIERENNI